jgi:hypothetical protein
MNGKFLMAALAAAVAVFIGGWVIYGMILMDYMAAHSFMKEAPAMWGIAAGNLFSGLLYAYVCQLAGIKSFGKGLTTGALLGCLLGLSTNFIMLGGGMFDSAVPMLIDTVGIVVLTGLGCGVAGALMAKGSDAAAGTR